eukprot:7388173-Prymnesium_polylepis.2
MNPTHTHTPPSDVDMSPIAPPRHRMRRKLPLRRFAQDASGASGASGEEVAATGAEEEPMGHVDEVTPHARRTPTHTHTPPSDVDMSPA